MSAFCACLCCEAVGRKPFHKSSRVSGRIRLEVRCRSGFEICGAWHSQVWRTRLFFWVCRRSQKHLSADDQNRTHGQLCPAVSDCSLPILTTRAQDSAGLSEAKPTDIHRAVIRLETHAFVEAVTMGAVALRCGCRRFINLSFRDCTNLRYGLLLNLIIL